MDEQRLAEIEARLVVLEARTVQEYVWVVMYEMHPRYVFRTEEEAEAMVVSLLKPGLYRAIGSGCWFKVPIS